MSKHAAAMRARLREQANPNIAAHSTRFFKTGRAGYAADDRFLGVRVPVVRNIAREFRGAPLAAALTLLRSRLHEERLLALVLMVDLFERGDDEARAAIYAQYLKHTPRYVNNWDLVDSSAYQIVGTFLAVARPPCALRPRALARAFGSGASRSSRRSGSSRTARSTTRWRSQDCC